YSTLRRLAVGDTAGWQPALRVRFMESPLSAFPACIGTMNLPGKSKAPQERRTPKPGGGSGGLGQRASVLECGGPPPLSKGARMRNSYGSWKAAMSLPPCIGTMNPPPAPPRRGAERFGQFPSWEGSGVGLAPASTGSWGESPCPTHHHASAPRSDSWRIPVRRLLPQQVTHEEVLHPPLAVCPSHTMAPARDYQ